LRMSDEASPCVCVCVCVCAYVRKCLNWTRDSKEARQPSVRPSVCPSDLSASVGC